MECAPPANITSASPLLIRSHASPIAWLLAAHAVRQLLAGPRQPNAHATWLSVMFASCSISRCGTMRRYAAFAHAGPSIFRSVSFQPATCAAA